MGSGKDTYAEKLKKYYPNSVQLSFAKSVKDELTDILSNYHTDPSKQVSDHYVFNQTVAQTKPGQTGYDRTPEIRKCLQLLGTEIRRTKDPDYWIKKTKEMIDKAKEPIIFITDARFENELEFLAKNYIHIPFFLDISEEAQIKRIEARDGFKPTLSNHPSEHAYKNYQHENIVHINSEYPLEHNVAYMKSIIDEHC